MAKIEGVEISKVGAGEVSRNQSVEAGVYRHPETGAEVVTKKTKKYGNAQSEGIVRLGFVRVRDARPEDYGSPLQSQPAKRVEQGKGEDVESLKAQLAEAQRQLAEANEATPQPGEEAEESPTNLGEMSRNQLNELAAQVGVENPDKLPNKDSVIEAIEASGKKAEAEQNGDE